MHIIFLLFLILLNNYNQLLIFSFNQTVKKTNIRHTQARPLTNVDQSHFHSWQDIQYLKYLSDFILLYS